ncbi:C-type lectin domain-containing protein [Photobacterium damselae]
MVIKKVFDLCLIFITALSLLGCNGGDSDNSDSGSNLKPAIEQYPIINNDFFKPMRMEEKQKINFMEHIFTEYDADDLSVNLNVLEGGCKFLKLNNTTYEAISESEGLCVIEYSSEGLNNERSSAEAFLLASKSGILTSYPPFSHLTTTAGETLSIDIIKHLESLGIDTSDLVIDEHLFTTGVGSSSFDLATNKITFKSDEFGVSSIFYSMKNSSGSYVGFGRVDISVSSDLNTMPIANNAIYPDIIEFGKEYIVDLESLRTPTGEPLIMDPDSGDSSLLQLIDLNSYEGLLTFFDEADVYNKKFRIKIPASASNVFDAAYTITDHNGGYAVGIIRFRVNSPSDLTPWKDIYYKNYKRFIAPMTKEIADIVIGFPVLTSNIEDDIIIGKSFNVITLNYDDALNYCSSLGAKLPTEQEFNNLFKIQGNLYLSDKWPHKQKYWLDSGKIFDVNNGSILVSSSDSLNYITCVKGGLRASKLVKDNSFADGVDLNEVAFYLESVWGLPFSNELVSFEGDSDLILPTPAFTDLLGWANAKVSSLLPGSYSLTGKYIDDSITETTNFSKAPIVRITGASDSCIYGKCTRIPVVASASDEYSEVYVSVTHPTTGDPVVGAKVEINRSSRMDPDENDIIFHFSTAGDPAYSSTSICVTSVLGICSFNVKRIDNYESFLDAYFDVSIVGSADKVEDYLSYTSLFTRYQGHFDFNLHMPDSLAGDPLRYDKTLAFEPLETACTVAPFSPDVENYMADSTISDPDAKYGFVNESRYSYPILSSPHTVLMGTFAPPPYNSVAEKEQTLNIDMYSYVAYFPNKEEYPTQYNNCLKPQGFNPFFFNVSRLHKNSEDNNGADDRYSRKLLFNVRGGMGNVYFKAKPLVSIPTSEVEFMVSFWYYIPDRVSLFTGAGTSSPEATVVDNIYSMREGSKVHMNFKSGTFNDNVLTVDLVDVVQNKPELLNTWMKIEKTFIIPNDKKNDIVMSLQGETSAADANGFMALDEWSVAIKPHY